MYIFKKIFFILLVLDFAELILVGIALYPTFKQLAGYGQLMLGVASVIAAVIVTVLLFEILAKIFLLRSTSPTFSWSSGRKGYAVVAILLLLFNFGALILGLLSIGGEGATVLNQSYAYLQMLASVAEIITAFLYLRTIKKLFNSTKEDC
jgi:hypothetical protein